MPSTVAAAAHAGKAPPLIKSAWLRWALVIGAAVYLALAFGTIAVNWTRVWEGLPRGGAFVSAFFPPDFVSRWDEIAEGIAESLWMTVVATVVGIALSIPVGIGAANNIAPAPVYYFCRGVLAVSRSFQEIILAIFFVKLFGFGPFAGFVTLSFATIGFYGKLLAEDIEDMDAGAGGGGARHRRELAAMDQLRRAAAGDAAHDRAWPLPLRHQFPRIRGDRHCRRRRHRRHAQHRVRPLRVRFRRRDPAGHHRHRDGCANTAPAICGAGCSDGDDPGTARTWQRRAPRSATADLGGWLVAAALFVGCFQLISDNTIWAFVCDAPPQAADLAVRMVPPRLGYIRDAWRPIWDTINIATIGTRGRGGARACRSPIAPRATPRRA